jgi:phosphoribosylformylglycinamidine cyclo-ligase
MAHITGGGLLENVPRMLPRHARALIRTASWPKPPIFEVLHRAGKLATDELYRTFNYGIGLVMVVRREDANDIVDRLHGMHEEAFLIGEIVPREDGGAPIALV